ncbi:MAG: ornithine carbamoyltransferase, catabolic [Fimbriimonadales bacterium]|nr:MAG: ornithine carbamoyltransferase, catabolic [Fimbriimonadales bacterium]
MYNLFQHQEIADLAVIHVGAGPRHLLQSSDLTGPEVRTILDLAHALKKRRALGLPIQPVENRTLAMIFEKQSLRTRFTFETAMRELGGHAIYLTKQDIDMGKRESVYDVAKNLSQWSSLIVARLYEQATIEELAAHSEVPVINALTDQEHPCQALADVMTIEECFGKQPVKIAYVGDGNNVANSLAVTAALLGHEVVISSPPGYECKDSVYAYPNVHHVYDPIEAVTGAQVVYTDVWVSMGQEEETELRLQRFAKYQVNDELMQRAAEDCIFLHCLPARRGLEVTEDVIDGPKSKVFEQANNRLHAQKAVMQMLLEGALA